MTEEPLLQWNDVLQRWECADGHKLIWMTTTTLEIYASAYLMLRAIYRPTARQKDAALLHCRRVGYYDHIADPERVHVVPSARMRAGK